VRVIGYVRVSTEEQGRSGLGLAAQRAAILAARPDAEIVEEVASGGRADNRPRLEEVRASLQRGDVLVVSRLDRLTRSLYDFADLVREAERRGWSLTALDMASTSRRQRVAQWRAWPPSSQSGSAA
jgi:DNA invertase Pin-like site-specific DNA recombinase